MIRAYYKNSTQYKDFEDFLFLFPEKHRIEFDFASDTIWIDGTAFQLSKMQFLSDDTAELDARYEKLDNKNKANGYAGLDENAKIPSDLLPSIRVVDVHVVNNSRDLATLTDVDEGDLAIVVNDNKTFVWSGSQWIEVLFSESVKSVDGRTGAVTLTDLYAEKDHEHNRLVGENLFLPVLEVTHDTVRSINADFLETHFVPADEIRFNALAISTGTPITVDDVTLEISSDGQVLFSGKPSSIEQGSSSLERVLILDKDIVLTASKEAIVSIHLSASVYFNMPENDNYDTYHNVTGYVNPQKASVFNALFYLAHETVTLTEGRLEIQTKNGQIDDLVGAFSTVESNLATLQAITNNLDNRISANEAKFSQGKTITFSFFDNNSNLVEWKFENGLLVSLKINGTEQ